MQLMLFEIDIIYLYMLQLQQLYIICNVFHLVHILHCCTVGICPKCTLQTSSAVEAPLLAGIVPTVVLLLANVVTGVVAVLITRHCYKKTSQKSCPLKGEDVYDQVEGPKTYEDIAMTDSPAYGPVK